MTPQKDAEGRARADANGVEILDLDYTLPPAPSPAGPSAGPPAPSEPREGLPRASTAQPRTPSEYEPRISGNYDPKAGSSSITLGADGPDLSGQATLANGRQGQTVSVQAAVLDGRDKTSAQVSIGPGNTDSVRIVTGGKDNEAGLIVGTRGGEAYASANARVTADGVRLEAATTLGNGRAATLSATRLIDENTELGVSVGADRNGRQATVSGRATIGDTAVAARATFGPQDSARVDITQPLAGGSLSVAGTVASTSSVEASYRNGGASVTAKAGTDGEFSVMAGFRASLPGGARSGGGGGSRGIDYDVAAGDLHDSLDVLSGGRDERARRASAPAAPTTSAPATPASAAPEARPADRIEPNPRLLSQATGLVESANRNLPSGMSALPVAETAASLAVLAERRGLSGIGFVEVGGPTPGGRNLFIGQESSIREQAASFGQHVSIGAQEAGRGPTPAMLADLGQARATPAAPEPALEQQRSQGARSM